MFYWFGEVTFLSLSSPAAQDIVAGVDGKTPQKLPQPLLLLSAVGLPFVTGWHSASNAAKYYYIVLVRGAVDPKRKLSFGLVDGSIR